MADIKITDTPNSNYEALCNFCRYVDNSAKFLETAAGKDTDIYGFCRKQCKNKCDVNFPERDDGTMVETMCFDCCMSDCVIYLLYNSAVQAAELREHIKNYNSDNGEPVKHGHWIYADGIFKCSECDYEFEHEGYIHFFNFCPGCGVRIEGVIDKTDTIAERSVAILNCPECGGEADMGKMNFCTGKKSASALFECKKCHYYRNVMTEYTNNPQTALILAWNDYVVSQEAYKTVKNATKEINPNGVPVDCVKCRFYNGHLEYCRKHSAKILPFCFCYDGEERAYHIKVTTDNSLLSEAISDMPEYVQQHYAEYWHNKILSDGKEQGNDGKGQAD